jgi:hypothetical protein
LATTWLAAGCHYDPGPTPKPELVSNQISVDRKPQAFSCTSKWNLANPGLLLAGSGLVQQIKDLGSL